MTVEQKDLFRELYSIAASVQQSARSEADVFSTYRQEIARAGLRGNLSLVDACGENLVMQFAFIPASIQEAFKSVEGITELSSQGHTFPIEDVPLYREVMESRKAMFCPDSAEIVAQVLPAHLRSMAGKVVEILGSTSQIIAPLVSGDKVIGTITLGGSSGLSADDVPAVEALAAHLVNAIENARLFTALQRQIQERELLDKVLAALSRNLELDGLVHTVVEAIAAVFGYTQVSVYMREDGQLHLQHQVGYDHVIEWIPLDKGISGRVVRTAHPVWLEDVHAAPEFLGAIEGITSEICVPLFDKHDTVGVLNVESSQGVRLTESDLRLMLALSEHINIAIERARLYEEIRRFSAQLEQRVSERTMQLETALGDLESLSYSISHALRSPLRAVRSYGQILTSQHSDQLDSDGEALLKHVNDAANNMNLLVENMQELFKITRAQMMITPVNLGGLFAAIFDRLCLSEPERQTELVIAPQIIVQGDAAQLQLLSMHLASNAWKFTSKNALTRIEFGEEQNSGETIYFLRDNGVGFDMRYADRLFGPMHRLHTPDEFPGYGMGLAIVQRVVRRHGGRIWAESEVGKGAIFYFTLPGGSA